MADDYRLAPVRRGRAHREAVRRGELATAVGDARATEDQLAAARARTQVARDALAMALTSAQPATAAELVTRERFVARRRRELADAQAAELRAAATHDHRLDAIDLARGQLAHARAERELIERHFARWREARAKLIERRAED